MRCLVVDDDILSLKLIEQFVNETDVLELVGSYTDPVKASIAIVKDHVDVILLDVEMPNMTGLQLIQNIPETTQVILITSQKDYAFDAFEHEVTDFLLKPVSYSRFLKAIDKAKEKFAPKVPLTSAASPNLYVKEESVWVNIPLEEVVWIEALGDYVNINLKDKKHTVLTTMKTIESKLNDNFMRVHRSYIVNLSKITNLDGNMLVVGKKLIPIGKSHKKLLLDKLNII